MTLPVPHGYPDWGRFQARADVILHQEFGTVLSQGVTRGRFFTGGTEHVAFRFDSLTQPCTVTIQWYTTPTLGLQLGQQIVEVGGPGEFELSVPVAGPWLAISITPVAFPATITLVAWTVTGPVAALRLNMCPEILFSDPSSVPPATNVVVELTRTAPGLAQIHVFSQLAVYAVVVEALTAGGNPTELYSTTTVNVPVNDRFFLPAQRIRITRSNQTGVAGGILAVLVRTGIGMIGYG